MRIISLDPGGETGVLIWYSNTGKSHVEQLSGEHHLLLLQLLEQQVREVALYEGRKGKLIIICERFDNRNRFAELISCEYIGVVKAFSQQVHPITVTVVWQSASQIKPPKGWASNDKLECLDLLPKSPTRKDRKDYVDATRHFVYFVCHNDLMADSLVRKEMMAKLKELVTA